MSYTVYEDKSGHQFQKNNLVTNKSNQGFFDSLQCKNCGVKAKRHAFASGIVEVDGRTTLAKAHQCPSQKKENNTKNTLMVKITSIQTPGKEFENLVPGSSHKIIPAPEGEDNQGGCWVMGNGSPIKIIEGEFEAIT